MFHHNTMKRDGFSADMDYEKFLKKKEITIENTGFEPDYLNANVRLSEGYRSVGIAQR